MTKIDRVEKVGLRTGLPLWVCQCGFEACEPKHTFGPAVRDHYLIHYIKKGKGTFSNPHGTFQLKENEGFLIYPNEVTVYSADVNEPWEYYWVGFRGTEAPQFIEDLSLSNKSPVFNYDPQSSAEEYFKNMLKVGGSYTTKEMQRIGYLYLFLAHIQTKGQIEGKSEYTTKAYFHKAVQYIEDNYSYDISVSKLAHHIGIDRTYLFKIFKTYLGVAPEQYILETRLKKAAQLLKTTQYPIVQIAYSTGFKEVSYFSRAFKKIYHISPSKYRYNA